MEHAELVSWLRQGDADRLQGLWDRADAVRRQHVGDAVHLRGLIEFSNHCVRRCAYCGLHVANRDLVRYRMTEDEILDCARQAAQFGYGTVVLQSGEDLGVAAGWISGVVRRIKSDTGLAVTLSLGERGVEELETWHAAGADRYLLRFETSNVELFQRLHPPRPGQLWPDRVALLRQLRQIGYEVGSGVMIGIPGQTYDDLARDIALFAELHLDMVGVGPYLPHPDTPLADANQAPSVPHEDQVPGSELMTYKVIALTRLTCPLTNIPATTALATLNRANGRELGLRRGANVIMPNLTPVKYRAMYEIYPDKACVGETADACRTCLESRIRGIGRHIGTGRGDSPHFHGGTSSYRP
jgi:biotin synthase